jgi:2'-5' RNA ligase
MEYIAIYIKPPNKLIKELGKYTKKISGAVIKLNPLGPHCTLIGSFFKDEKKLLKSLNKIKFNTFQLETSKYNFFENNNLVIEVKRSKEIHKLHQQIIDSVKDNIVKPKENKYKRFNSPKRLATFKKYGDVFRGEFYNPHISIAKMRPHLENKDKKFIDKSYNFKNIKFNVNNIYLARKIDKKWTNIMEIRASN